MASMDQAIQRLSQQLGGARVGGGDSIELPHSKDPFANAAGIGAPGGTVGTYFGTGAAGISGAAESFAPNQKGHTPKTNAAGGTVGTEKHANFPTLPQHQPVLHKPTLPTHTVPSHHLPTRPPSIGHAPVAARHPDSQPVQPRANTGHAGGTIGTWTPMQPAAQSAQSGGTVQSHHHLSHTTQRQGPASGGSGTGDIQRGHGGGGAAGGSVGTQPSSMDAALAQLDAAIQAQAHAFPAPAATGPTAPTITGPTATAPTATAAKPSLDQLLSSTSGSGGGNQNAISVKGKPMDFINSVGGGGAAGGVIGT